MTDEDNEDFDLKSLIGLPYAEVQSLFYGVTRVARVGGKGRFLTRDYRKDRLNVELSAMPVIENATQEEMLAKAIVLNLYFG